LKVLVTGGAGFIGSVVAHRLVAQGAQVIVLDDLSSGSVTAIPDGVELVEQDIADGAAGEVITALRPSHVIHAAAQVRVARSMDAPRHDRRVNLDGTHHVLDGARRAGVERFVFVSSGGAVYGESVQATETTVPAPRSYYGVHKLAAEGYVALFGRSHAVARLANVYGPGQRDDLEGGVVAIFMRAVGAGGPVTIHGDGEQRRDFVHVDDVADALVAMLVSDRSGVWNVGTGQASSINALVELLEQITGRQVERLREPARIGDVRSSSLAITAIGRDLGWAPRIDLDSGLRLLIREGIGPGRASSPSTP
jgi:UDP-glucose 4-epimerase